MLNKEVIYFQKKDSEEDEILGRTWIQRTYKSDTIEILYKEVEYDIKFDKNYRYVILNYSLEKQKLTIEFSKLPWVTYHE